MPKVGDNISASNARWSFEGTSESFDQHIARSIPRYAEGQDLVVDLADYFLHPGSRAYELGCATGSLTAKLAASAPSDTTLIAMDCEPDMVRAAKLRTQCFPHVQVVQADVVDVDYEPCDLIAAYYTVQFVRPSVRQVLIDKLFKSLNWGGALILFEKVRAPDARFQDILSSMYQDYKLRQGFSEHEIVHKSRSLKGRLEPFSTQGNLDLMRRAGFVDITTVFKHICFEGFLAIK